MKFLILIPAYVLLNLYVLWRSLSWLKSVARDFSTRVFPALYIGAYAVMACSMLIAFLLPDGTAVKQFVKLLSNYWLGCQLYMLMAVLLVDLLRLILLRTGLVRRELIQSRTALNVTGTLLMILIIGVTAGGTVHAQDIKERSYDVVIEKSCERKELKIALVADWHLGYNVGLGQMQRMADKINAADVDLVCVAGDMFDNEYDAVQAPDEIIEVLKGIRSTYGVYACWGNHDVAEPILGGFTFSSSEEQKGSDPRMDEFLKKAGIHVLEDEAVCVGDAFYLAGRLDYLKPGRTAKERKTPQELTEGLDLSKPVIVMDHEPRQLKELAAAGADLDLSGHTHNGQIFPGSLTIGLFWENAYGCIEKDGMTSVVTSGVGVWGPNMRIGTDSEIVYVNVSFR